MSAFNKAMKQVNAEDRFDAIRRAIFALSPESLLMFDYGICEMGIRTIDEKGDGTGNRQNLEKMRERLWAHYLADVKAKAAQG